MTPHRFEPLSSSRLARLFDLDLPSTWNNDDRSAALRHQLQAPLLPSLAICPDISQEQIKALIATGCGPATFGGQLTSTQPTLKLLSAIKLFAKHVDRNLDNPLSGSASKVLYFAAIGAALVHCQQRITLLPDRRLCEGFGWAMGQSGSASLNEVFRAALQRLQAIR